MAKTKVAPDQNVGRNIATLMASNVALSSQPALAKKTGVAQSTIGRILRGESNASGEVLKNIAAAFGIEVGGLYLGPTRFEQMLRDGMLGSVSTGEVNIDENPAFPAVRRVKFKL